MDFVRLEYTGLAKWNTLWGLYENSFPAVERRRLEDYLRAMEDKAFNPLSVWENGEFIGLLFYWDYNEAIYVEHLAVSPTTRNSGHGGKILDWLKQKGKILILEIEPLGDEQSHRRLGFYEREKFCRTPYSFLQLPYRKNLPRKELLILSYPKSITQQEYSIFSDFVNDYVAKYCEQ